MGYSRKPTKGTSRNYQTVTHKKDNDGKPVRLTIPVDIPAAFNKAGEMIRAAFTYNKPITKSIVHFRTAY